MKKRLGALMSLLLVLQSPPAVASNVIASSGATMCNQTVDNPSGVVAYRSDDSFCVVEFRNVGSTTWTLPSGVTSLIYLLVAGGGSGAGGQASEHGGGGGGAGGVLSGTLNNPATSLSIAVGAGGAAVSAAATGINGSASSLGSSLTAIGGGGGGSYFGAGPSIGGSGGGAGNSATISKRDGANGTAGQGNKGGNVTIAGTDGRHAAGGGGALTGGGNTVSMSGFTITAGVGGDGISSSITGTSTRYGGGGGGGGSSARGGSATGGGAGGLGGGGTGATYDGSSTVQATQGTNNRGGGGGGGTGTGGASASVSAAGGSGIIIVRYAIVPTSVGATISIPAGALVFREAKTITATTTVAGRITFLANGKRVPGCINKSVLAQNSFVVTCSYRPSTRGTIVITTALIATDSAFIGGTNSSGRLFVTNRSVKR